MIKKIINIVTILNFLLLGALPWDNVFAQESLFLPPAGQILPLSPTFTPPMIKGLRVHQDNPFEFDFIINQGQENLAEGQFKEESMKLVKYFLASLAIPENDLWVNLSPYEKNRITTPELGFTAMGKDLLSQDYVLKQLTSSLIYPQCATGKKFWSRVYALAEKKYHTTNVPINTFNKVWIVPQKAVIYENSKSQTAYIVESRLKVMLEEDYLAFKKRLTTSTSTDTVGSQVLRDIVIPELTQEVNTGKNFANLRQITNSLILAAWFKRALKMSILGRLYVDQKKMAGVDLDDKTVKERIYRQYLRAYRQRVYNYIQEERDPVSNEITPRKYFSGGYVFHSDFAMTAVLPAGTGHTADRAVTIKFDNALVSSKPPSVRKVVDEYLRITNRQLPYDSVDGPETLAPKLAAYIHQRLGLDFSPEQVLTTSTADEVTTMLGRIIKGGDKGIKTIQANDFNGIEPLKNHIKDHVFSVIRLKQGYWDMKLVYDIWQYCVAHQILLFIEENPKQDLPQEDLIEKALAQPNAQGGEYVLRYLSLSSLNKVVKRSGVGVLATHNEQLLDLIRHVTKNVRYMNLEVLTMAYLLASLPDVEGDSKTTAKKYDGGPFFSGPGCGIF